MLIRVGRLVCILALLVTASACAPAPRFVLENEGGVALEPLKDLNSIPLAWGRLVTVTTSGTTERGTPSLLLWFQDEAGNIHQAAFNSVTNQLVPAARVFRRK